MDDPGSSTTLLAVFFLLVANALLAAAEFSLIAVRRSRLERPGDAAARALPAPSRLEELAFAAQVGRSFAALLLGWLAAALATGWLARPGGALGATGAALVGVAAAALLHATLGQQVPKLLAVHRAERVAPRLVGPLELLRRALWPVLWVMGAVVRGTVRLFGVRDAVFLTAEPTPEELRAMVEQASDRAEIEEEEREMIRGVFEFRGTVAREVMTPRTEVVAVPVDVSLEELLRVVTEEGHSRIPVYEGTVDHVVGVLLAKDLLPVLAGRGGGAEPFRVRALLREPLFVPDTKPVNALLSELRSHGVHLAIVVDEFGGTYGLVTMEDLLEEIVGEIRDEYDEASEAEPEWEPTPEGDVLIDGAASIGEVNERFGLALPEEDFDTVGGYVFGALGRLPVAGDAVPVEGPEGRFELRVEETEERRVSTLRLSRAVEAAEAAPPAAPPVQIAVPAISPAMVVSTAGAATV